MRDKSHDSILDLNESVDMLLEKVDAADAKLLRLDEIATTLRQQASTLDRWLANTDKLVNDYKQIIEESAEVLRSSTSAVEQSKETAVAAIGLALERALEAHRRQVAESQTVLRQELEKLIDKMRVHFAEDIEKISSSQCNVCADLEGLLADTANTFESQVAVLRMQIDEFAQVEAGKVKTKLGAAFELWEAGNMSTVIVDAVAKATASALAELRAEIITELRKPWWKRRPRE